MRKAVRVVYYLSRRGRLEQPHLIEIELDGKALRLRDVKEKLAAIRGKDMPDSFSWAYKRSYKNDFIWNDVTGDDAIWPIQDEYILKASENVYGAAHAYEDQNPGAIETANKQPPPTVAYGNGPRNSTDHLGTLRASINFTDVKLYKSPDSPVIVEHDSSPAAQIDLDQPRVLRTSEPESMQPSHMFHRHTHIVHSREGSNQSLVAPALNNAGSRLQQGHMYSSSLPNQEQVQSARVVASHSRDDRPLSPGRSRVDWEKTLLNAINSIKPPADFRQTLEQCPQCGRTFKPDSLQVHLRGCHGPSSKKPTKTKTVANTR